MRSLLVSTSCWGIYHSCTMLYGCSIPSWLFGHSYCILLFFFFLLSAILIALVQPYKSTYMNVLDTLLLGLTVYACAGLSEKTTCFEDVITQLLVVFFLPSVAFRLILALCILIKSYRQLSILVKAKLLSQRNYSISKPDDQLQPLLIGDHDIQS